MSGASTPPSVPRGPVPWSTADALDVFGGDPIEFELRPGETLEVTGPAEAVAARRFRDVLGRFATGVTVVTAMVEGHPVGMTAQSFASVSLDPPLVLWCPAKTSRAWPLIRRSGAFCVNLLAAHQADLSAAMAHRGTDKFAGVSWAPTAITGSPRLEGILGHLDCTIEDVHEAGDHYIVVGRVLSLDTTEATDALLFYEGRYLSTGPD